MAQLAQAHAEVVGAGRQLPRRAARPEGPPGPGGPGQPPQARRGQVQAHRQGVGNAQALAELEEDQVDQEQEPAAQVAHGPAVGGHPVLLLGAGDVRQVGVVEDQGRPEGQVGHDEEPASQPPQIALDEVHREGGQGAQGGEEAQHLLAQVRVVGDGAQHRQEEDLQQHRGRDAVGHEGVRRHGDAQEAHGVRAGRLGRGPGQAGHVGPDEDRHHRGTEGRVGPVVHGPAADLPRVALRRAGRGRRGAGRRLGCGPRGL